MIRPKKRCLFALFRPTQKFGKLGLLFFFFFMIFNFAFLNKTVEKVIFKMHLTVPKVNCVGIIGTEGLFVHPIHASTRLFDVTYLIQTTI